MIGLPELVLVAGIFVLIPLGGMTTGMVMQWLKTKERMLAIEKGVPLPPEPEHTEDPWETAANFRLGGLICHAVGVGLLIVFAALAATIPAFPKGVIATAVIPILIGVVLFHEHRVRLRELGPRPKPPASTPRRPAAAE